MCTFWCELLFPGLSQGLSDYAQKIQYYAFERHPWNQGIMLKIMLGWGYNAEIMQD